MKKLRNKIGGEVKIFTAKWLNSKFDTDIRVFFGGEYRQSGNPA